MDFFLSKNQFTLMDYKQYVNDQLAQMNKGLIRKILSNDEESEQEMKEQKNIL